MTSKSNQLLEVSNIHIVSPRTSDGEQSTIVEDVSFSLNKGEIIGLIGESGAGKSTIGLACMGYSRGGCQIVGGQVLLNGTNLLELDRNQIKSFWGSRVCYVAQSAAAAFNPATKLNKQIIEACTYHNSMDKDEASEFAIDIFRRLQLPNPETFGERYPHQVSGGQLQRAMTAMALCSKPDLIVFDEPTTALDVTTQLEVLSTMKKVIEDFDTAGIYITHDLAVIAQMADHIMVLRHGRTVEYGSVDQIMNNPQQDYSKQLIAAFKQEKPIQEKQQDELLAINNISAGYHSELILSDISLSVKKGTTLAIVGESGSGKSTMARVITGLLPAKKGSLVFQGQTLPIDVKNRNKQLRRQIQMIYQIPDTAINPRHKVIRIIGRPLSFYFGLSGKALEKRVIELLEMIELDETFLHRYPSELSGGQKQRICLARALAAEPDLIICDEITSALDTLVGEGILRLLNRLQKETDISYFFITHDIETVMSIADNIAVLHKGKLVREGDRSSVFQPPLDDYTQNLINSVPKKEIGWLEQAIAKQHQI